MKSESKDLQNKSVDLLQLIWKWKLHLGIVFILAVVISSIYAMKMEEEYAASAVIFPSKSTTINLSVDGISRESSTKFGGETEAEQMIQIANSSEIRDRIVKDFGLMKVYKIDSNSSTKRAELIQNYDGHVSAKRTRFGSIRVKVYDVLPERAANIANEICSLIDSVKNNMIRQRSLIEYNKVTKDYDAITLKLDRIQDSIRSLRILGVEPNDVKAQLYRTLSTIGRGVERERILEKIEASDKYSTELDALHATRGMLLNRQHALMMLLEQSKMNSNLRIAHKFMVEKAEPADKKARPVRWLIVASTSLLALIFAFFGILILAKIKELRA